MRALVFMSDAPRRLAAIITFGVAVFLSPVVALADTAPQPKTYLSVAQPAFAPSPMYLDPPFQRVPAQGKAVYINVPSYELIAFEDGEEIFRSRVIVGSPKNPTPELTAHTSVVRFRPTWTPTPEMIEEEGLSPEMRGPGRDNPLGLLAIRLDPGMLIYLHDTNNRKLFEREKRALSHGCIRVEKWDEVAAFVLGIPVEEVHRHAKGRRTFDMETEGVPVIVRYNTMFPNQIGMIQQHADIYGRDAAYVKALNTPSVTDTNWEQLPNNWN